MKISIASGKGGTGKTTVSVALALSIDSPVQLLDCDVEEPNCNLFLNAEINEEKNVCVPVPFANSLRCNGCGECSAICEFNAIISLGKRVLIFPELCHGCGGCKKVCPSGAIFEVDRKMGSIEIGKVDTLDFAEGKINIGEPMAQPLIKAVKKLDLGEVTTIIDCPPGNSCSLLAAVKGSDFVLLVTEPTPFGLHDLSLAVETMRFLEIPFGVLINRSQSLQNLISEFCEKENIPLIMQIPEDRKVAEAYSKGMNLFSALPDLKEKFSEIPNQIEKILAKQN